MGFGYEREKNPDQDTEPTPTPEDPAIPDMKKPVNPVHGEVIAYGALPAAAIEQTRSIGRQRGRTDRAHECRTQPVDQSDLLYFQYRRSV